MPVQQRLGGDGASHVLALRAVEAPRRDVARAIWRDVTGEERVTADLGRIVLFGDRSGTWLVNGQLDETEQSAFAGLEEPFAVAHKVYLHTILQERNKDAAPHAAARRTAAQLFQKMEHVMQRVVNQPAVAGCVPPTPQHGRAERANLPATVGSTWVCGHPT